MSFQTSLINVSCSIASAVRTDVSNLATWASTGFRQVCNLKRDDFQHIKRDYQRLRMHFDIRCITYIKHNPVMIAILRDVILSTAVVWTTSFIPYSSYLMLLPAYYLHHLKQEDIEVDEKKLAINACAIACLLKGLLQPSSPCEKALNFSLAFYGLRRIGKPITMEDESLKFLRGIDITAPDVGREMRLLDPRLPPPINPPAVKSSDDSSSSIAAAPTKKKNNPNFDEEEKYPVNPNTEISGLTEKYSIEDVTEDDCGSAQRQAHESKDYDL